MIRTVTIMKDLQGDPATVLDVVQKLNEYSANDGYRAKANGAHVYGIAKHNGCMYDITVSGAAEGDSLLLDSARAACFPVLVELLAIS